jgi:hypothetical protein
MCVCLLNGIALLRAATHLSGQQRKVEKVNEIEDDIRRIVGGHFTPDSYGPDIYNAIVARARGQAVVYIDVFESIYLSANFDAQAQSRLYLPSFLQLVFPSSPERTRLAATQLLKLYDAVMVIYDAAKNKDALLRLLPEETVRMLQRLDSRRKELRDLLSVPK